MADTTKSAAPSDDLFDEVSAYLTKKDVEGCLISFLATEKRRTLTSTDASGKSSSFDMIKGSLVVISGRPSEEFVSQMGDKLPVLLEEFAFTGVRLIDRAEASFTSGRPKLGKVKGGPNKHKGTSFEWNGDKLTEADKNAARQPAVRALMQRQIDLHAAATAPDDLFSDDDNAE